MSASVWDWAREDEAARRAAFLERREAAAREHERHAVPVPGCFFCPQAVAR